MKKFSRRGLFSFFTTKVEASTTTNCDVTVCCDDDAGLAHAFEQAFHEECHDLADLDDCIHKMRPNMLSDVPGMAFLTRDGGVGVRRI